jgi:hypothetical protein
MIKGKQGSQIQWTVSWVMIALFTVAIITFAVAFASDNESPITISNDPELSSFSTQMNTEIDDFGSSGESTSGSILNSTISPTSASGTLTTVSPFSLSFGNFIGIGKNIMSVAYSKIFGENQGFQIFLTTFIVMIGVITALLIWKTFRGQPD